MYSLLAYDNQGDSGDVVELARSKNLKQIIFLHEKLIALVVETEEDLTEERFLLEIVDMSTEPRRRAAVVNVSEGTCKWEEVKI